MRPPPLITVAILLGFNMVRAKLLLVDQSYRLPGLRSSIMGTFIRPSFPNQDNSMVLPTCQWSDSLMLSFSASFRTPSLKHVRFCLTSLGYNISFSPTEVARQSCQIFF